jgi:hypothetical protein
MVKTMRKAIVELQRDVTRWKAEIAGLEPLGHSGIVEQLEGWIREAQRIISGSGHA